MERAELLACYLQMSFGIMSSVGATEQGTQSALRAVLVNGT